MPPEIKQALLCEVSWEVCQQLGGIYTVLRSKTPAMTRLWDRRYVLVGPYNPATTPAEFEPATPVGIFGKAVKTLLDMGIEAHFGHWLITGRPRVVLLNPACARTGLNDLKRRMWEDHAISTIAPDELVDEVLSFGSLVEKFFQVLTQQEAGHHPVIGHFHEWMAASAIPAIRKQGLAMSTVFTTHATQLGRFLAMSEDRYYENLPGVHWEESARRFNIESKNMIERTAAHSSDVLTTVSHITGLECSHLLGREPDVLLPNGLNIERFTALHEFQNLHRIYKDKINDFVMGHFFPSYTFDLDKTLYCFTSGRYEYGNKGFDLAIDAMARLNQSLKATGSATTVVFFIVTRAWTRSINSEVLHRRAVLEEIRRTCESIRNEIGPRLFVTAATGQTPHLDDLVSDYWRLRLRRTQHAWKTDRLPPIVTHDMHDENDIILRQLRDSRLFNLPDDPVKVVYHPDFITPSDPLFGMDYDQFVRGCHLGIFPSAYEPWGYAPLECMALGIPAVTSDLAGFGAYLNGHPELSVDQGMFVLQRRGVAFSEAARSLADWIYRFTDLTRRERIALRNRIEQSSSIFDWSQLATHYSDAHALALTRSTGAPDLECP